MSRSGMLVLIWTLALGPVFLSAAEQRPGRGRQHRDVEAETSASEPDRIALTDLSPAQRATIIGIIDDLHQRFPMRTIRPIAIGRHLQTVDQELFNLLDRNGNGILERHELPQRLWGRPPRRSQRQLPDDDTDLDTSGFDSRLRRLHALHPALARHVTDADGEIDPARLHTAWQRYQALLERFDDDGDGRLSGDERHQVREVMAAWLQEIREGAQRPQTDARAQPADEALMRSELHQRMIERYDRDGDGRLDVAERAAAHSELKERLQQRLEMLRQNHPDLFAAIDSNDDGEISTEELRTWRQKRQQERQQRKAQQRRGRGRGRSQTQP